MKKVLIAIALLAAPAHAANYDYSLKAEPATCVGVIIQHDDGTLALLGDEGAGIDCRYGELTFRQASPAKGQLGPSTAPFILRACSAGMRCKIKGLLKDIGYETFYWSRIDSARPSDD
jgi:hypothetical protein